MNSKVRAKKILNILKKHYGYPKITLNYKNNLELLISVMLSAQTTDKAVNKVTPLLFRRYKNPKDFANANLKDLEKYIHSIGLYKTKARNIKAVSKIITDRFHGKVPKTMNELLELPGVGRKTANVVLSQGFGKNEGIAVDTHVKRFALKFKLSKSKNPKKIEKDLMQLFEKKDWKDLTMLFISHGREKREEVSLLLDKM